jgi:hypothetical protein
LVKLKSSKNSLHSSNKFSRIKSFSGIKLGLVVLLFVILSGLIIYGTITVVLKLRADTNIVELKPEEPVEGFENIPSFSNSEFIFKDIKNDESVKKFLSEGYSVYRLPAGSSIEDVYIYYNEILPAFEKLVENLINIHKFTSLHDSYDDLKTDCVNFLFETIGKFDGERGTNAFSYFNVVAKNWLIIRTKQKTLRIKRSVSIDDPDSLSMSEMHIIEEYSTIPSQDAVLEHENIASGILDVLFEIRSKIKTENELACVNSIITIFENIEDIDLLNKSAILLYMRELSGLSPKQLTTTMQSVKKYYKHIKIDAKFKPF